MEKAGGGMERSSKQFGEFGEGDASELETVWGGGGGGFDGSSKMLGEGEEGDRRELNTVWGEGGRE